MSEVPDAGVHKGPEASGNGVVPLNGRSVDRAHAKDLFRRFVETRSPALREELVGLHLPLVEYLARRFRNRGEPLDDLVQVATIGLLKAIDRFDLEREVEFSTYATPTIVGELKRHFRDKGWAVRVPRRLQELNLSLNKVVAELSQEIGPLPHHRRDRRQGRGLPEEEVLEALDSLQRLPRSSSDAPAGDEDGPGGRERIGAEDDGLEARRVPGRAPPPDRPACPSASAGSSTCASSAA